MADSENKKSSENKKEKRTAKPKKATPKVHKVEMEIITTVRKIREAVKCNSVLKSYLIFQDILNYDTSVHWK